MFKKKVKFSDEELNLVIRVVNSKLSDQKRYIMSLYDQFPNHSDAMKEDWIEKCDLYVESAIKDYNNKIDEFSKRIASSVATWEDDKNIISTRDAISTAFQTTYYRQSLEKLTGLHKWLKSLKAEYDELQKLLSLLEEARKPKEQYFSETDEYDIRYRF